MISISEREEAAFYMCLHYVENNTIEAGVLQNRLERGDTAQVLPLLPTSL